MRHAAGTDVDMADAQTTEIEDEQPQSSSWGPRNWAAAIASITALLGAITGLIHALGDRTPGKPDKPDKPEQHQQPLQPPPPAKPRLLMWAPSDCTEGAAPGVAIDSCNELRTLEWLNLKMDELRSSNQFGFGSLPKGFKLVAGNSGSHLNYRLNVVDAGGQDTFSVGVGYNVKRNAKDGGLHVSRSGQMIAEAWLLPDNSWSGRPN